MYHVYILKGSSNPKYYIGSTSDIRKRFEQHNLGQNTSTKRGKPWKLIYLETYPDKTIAQKRERNLKDFGRVWQNLKKRIDATS